MRRILAALAVSAALCVPTMAAAQEVPPMPPALMCVRYRAATICMSLGDNATTYTVDAPYWRGVKSGPPIIWH